MDTYKKIIKKIFILSILVLIFQTSVLASSSTYNITVSNTPYSISLEPSLDGYYSISYEINKEEDKDSYLKSTVYLALEILDIDSKIIGSNFRYASEIYKNSYNSFRTVDIGMGGSGEDEISYTSEVRINLNKGQKYDLRFSIPKDDLDILKNELYKDYKFNRNATVTIKRLGDLELTEEIKTPTNEKYSNRIIWLILIIPFIFFICITKRRNKK